MIKAIVAMDRNRLIGQKGKLPWNLPEDLKYFKTTTLNQTVVMGRKTFESIGKPLSNRKNIVLSTKVKDIPNVLVYNDLDSLLKHHDDFWLIGGSQLYTLFLPLIERLEVSRIHGFYEGDSYFPDFKEHFDIVSIKRSEGITFESYKAKNIEEMYKWV